MKIFIILSLVAMIAGCSSTPTPIGNSKPISSDRIHNIEPLKNKQEFATLKILRDTASDDLFLDIEIWIDGKLSAVLKSKEIHTLKINPQEHIIEARINVTLGQIAPAQVETIFRQNRTYFYRVGYNHTARSVKLLRDVNLSK